MQNYLQCQCNNLLLSVLSKLYNWFTTIQVTYKAKKYTEVFMFNIHYFEVLISVWLHL